MADIPVFMFAELLIATLALFAAVVLWADRRSLGLVPPLLLLVIALLMAGLAWFEAVLVGRGLI